jgi:putative thioredoxin
VNSDENPGLSQAFGIRGIPAVKAFVDGRVANEFTGALPKSQVEEFLRTVLPSKEDTLAEEAAAAQAAGDTDRARELWSRLIAAEPEHGAARLQRARLLIAEGDPAGARVDLEAVTEDSGLQTEARTLHQVTEWPERVRTRGGGDAIRERAAAAPEDASARFDFGAALQGAGNTEGALAEFLEVVRLDRKFENDAGRHALLALFLLLGDQHDWTRDYRSRLARLLF